jgi:flavin reductase (DIM6/NTAB) family NADH-FMN oxidoreductase RutF
VRREVSIGGLELKPFDIWASRWFLLAAGNFRSGRFNAMTVAWGSLGRMWEMPFVQVVVRPTRHTFGFMESGSDFTLSAFPETHRKNLQRMGSISGSDGDKFANSGFTPEPSKIVSAPSFAEADLVFECRKIYSDDFKPDRFLDSGIHKHYPEHDYHRVYFGEIVALTIDPEQCL